MIARGNTNHIAYAIPEFTGEITELYVTYVQHSYVIVEKTLEDVNFERYSKENNSVIVHLTQDDTLRFKETVRPEKDSVKVQIRIKTSDNEAYSSQIMIDNVQNTLKEGII